MRRPPPYRTIEEKVGTDVVELTAYGGDFDAPRAAVVTVAGAVRLEILAPPTRPTWDAATEDRFRATARELAATHHLLDRTGAVAITFDPEGTAPTTEPVERA